MSNLLIQYILLPPSGYYSSTPRSTTEDRPHVAPAVCVHLRSVDNFDELTRRQQVGNFTELRERFLDCGKVHQQCSTVQYSTVQ